MMDDVEKYIKKRKNRSKNFKDTFEEDYEVFRIGILLRKAREDAGFTQEQIARKLHTKKSAISRIENHSENIRLSTLKDYVEALGKKLHLEIS
jgi:HTH-type transcriptional regulator/antitoxin HipB